MDEFTVGGIVGVIFGVLVGIILIVTLDIVTKPKAQKSGSYLTYENVIYKQVNQEELDNIIVLEVK